MVHSLRKRWCPVRLICRVKIFSYCNRVQFFHYLIYIGYGIDKYWSFGTKPASRVKLFRTTDCSRPQVFNAWAEIPINKSSEVHVKDPMFGNVYARKKKGSGGPQPSPYGEKTAN